MNDFAIDLELVPVQHHLLRLKLLMPFNFNDCTAWNQQFILIRIRRVLFIIKSETGIVDLVEYIQNKKNRLILRGGALRRDQRLTQIM